MMTEKKCVILSVYYHEQQLYLQHLVYDQNEVRSTCQTTIKLAAVLGCRRRTHTAWRIL
jgi:hypothetical protein